MKTLPGNLECAMNIVGSAVCVYSSGDRRQRRCCNNAHDRQRNDNFKQREAGLPAVSL